MTGFADFDILNVPLSGLNVVEASAGTGKTYSITGLFLRLIVESGLDVEKILVVTFTEAATQELKDRIRTRLAQAAAALARPENCEDDFLNDLKGRLGPALPVARQRLISSLRKFDQAAIFTIHGFCHRMLNEYAFESGLLFDRELVTSQETLKLEIAADFWRSRLYLSSPRFVRHVTASGLSPEALAGLLTGQRLSPHLTVRPEPGSGGTSEKRQKTLEDAFTDTFKQVVSGWRQYRSDIVETLQNAQALNRKKYNVKAVPAFISEMNAYTGLTAGAPELFDTFEKFTTSYIAESIKKGHAVITHDFFDICQSHQEDAQALRMLFDRRTAELKTEFIEYARRALDERKTDRNMLYFDDLVLNLYRALMANDRSSGARLAKAVCRKYPAALIDEFQDTDTVQYAIFSRLFSSGEQDVLFLIGDPKQSIYGFRGADIFAYLRAVRETQGAYTLTENWRSTPGLVESVNAMFEAVPEPFIFPEIGYHRVQAARKAKIAVLTGLASLPAMEIRIFESDSFPGRNNKDDWRRRVARDTAARIAEIVADGRAGRVCLDDDPLSEADIAVLVRTHAEAELVLECLEQRGVAGIIFKTGNVFDGHESFELQILLDALAFPEDRQRMKAALATDLLGWTAADIAALMNDEDKLEDRLATFAAYRDQWRRQGFMPMMIGLIHQEAILPRLMTFSDGERRCTNLFQLTEVLHKASSGDAAGPAVTGLIKWFDRQRHGGGDEPEAYQLRLASDARAVKIITIHKSKGLQYPILFCPFLWTTSSRNTGPVMFHDEDRDQRLTLDFYPEGHSEGDAEKQARDREQQAEEMRLVYVALTRARNHCCVSIVPDKAEKTAILSLLTGTAADLAQGLARLVKTTGEKVSVHQAAPGESLSLERLAPCPAAGLECRSFTGSIQRNFRIMSFSAMRNAGVQMDEHFFVKKDRGRPAGDQEEENVARPIDVFPKGAAAGLCLHELFEHLDFTSNDLDYRKQLVVDKLSRYNFDVSWQPVICEMLANVLTAELPQGNGARLEHIHSRQRLNELEFYFPLNNVSPEILEDVYRRSYPPSSTAVFAEDMGKLRFSPARGYMHGFMDLVFCHQDRYYLLDWKSNYLGDGLDAYTPEALGAEMRTEYYLFQSHVYTIALDRYLQARMPEYRYADHFGGIYYIFLRGVDASAGADYGIYYEKPPEGFVQALSDNLMPGD